MALYLWIALGGALGSALRFWLANLITGQWGEGFPWGTMIVNIAGCFVIGFFATFVMTGGKPLVGSSGRHFFATGVLGGFTTFSTFSLQTLDLAREGEWSKAGWNVVGSVALCLVAVWLGHVLAMSIRGTKGI